MPLNPNTASPTPRKRVGQGMVVSVRVSVVDPLKRPLDGPPLSPGGPRRPIGRPDPAIMDLAPVAEPLETGLKVIDAIVNQRDRNVVCVYCAIGQRASG